MGKAMNDTPTPRSDAAWRTAIAQLNQRDEREDPQHELLAALADQLETELAAAIRERDEARRIAEKQRDLQLGDPWVKPKLPWEEQP